MFLQEWPKAAARCSAASAAAPTWWARWLRPPSWPDSKRGERLFVCWLFCCCRFFVCLLLFEFIHLFSCCIYIDMSITYSYTHTSSTVWLLFLSAGRLARSPLLSSCLSVSKFPHGLESGWLKPAWAPPFFGAWNQRSRAATLALFRVSLGQLCCSFGAFLWQLWRQLW